MTNTKRLLIANIVELVKHWSLLRGSFNAAYILNKMPPEYVRQFLVHVKKSTGDFIHDNVDENDDGTFRLFSWLQVELYDMNKTAEARELVHHIDRCIHVLTNLLLYVTDAAKE